MKAMIIENLQKSLFRENEESLLHLLNNVAAAFPPFFSRKVIGPFWQRCTVLIWLGRALPGRLAGARTSSCRLPGLCTRGLPTAQHPDCLPQHLSSASVAARDTVWITATATCRAWRTVVSVILLHHDLVMLIQSCLHTMTDLGILEREKTGNLWAEMSVFWHMGTVLQLVSGICWTPFTSAWKLPVNS